jgi:hypothetical protein
MRRDDAMYCVEDLLVRLRRREQIDEHRDLSELPVIVIKKGVQGSGGTICLLIGRSHENSGGLRLNKLRLCIENMPSGL